MGFLRRLIDRLKPADPPAPPPDAPANPDAPPAPAPAAGRGVLGTLTAVIAFVSVAAWVVRLGLYLFGNGPPPGPMPPPPADGGPAVVAGFVPATGWVPDPAAVERVVREQAIPAFADTPAGKAAMGDQDAYLWRAVRTAAKLTDSRYPNINQRDVGCCVGCGWKHCTDVLLANQIASGQAAEWKPVSAEVYYGLSRVEVGGGRIRGDGSVGAWAAEAASKFGVVPMEKVGDTDLTVFDPYRARTFGSRGVPDDVEAVAKQFPVKGTALVRSWADVKRAVGQGYPVAVCSDQGFTMQRDNNGFARPSGTWMHCMAIIGVRTQPREGAFILNSWGDQAHTGPVSPGDMPAAGFWADAATVGRMVAQGDSFALSDAVGFPARQLPWFTRAAPARPFDIARPVFALAP